MKKIIPWLVYAASVFLSAHFAAGYWAVGLIFGIAVLLANFEAVRSKLSLQHLVFVVASILIYALVYWMADKGWKFNQDWLDSLIGSFSAGVVVGSLLLPFVHSILFGTDPKRIQSTALALIGSWYGVVLLSWLCGYFKIKLPVTYIQIAIALWQGIYLARLRLK
jgi:hypothetical protein